MERIFIVAAKRTPIGNFNGALSSLSGVELGAAAMRAALDQVELPLEQIDEVIVGSVLTGGTGMGPGRQAAIRAGLPESVPAYTINMICGSGMRAIMDAASHIRAGDSDIVLTCGMESMSNACYTTSGQVRRGYRLGHQGLEDSILKDGLTDAFHHYHMGITAENIATQLSISREEQDAFALDSQRKAAQAIEMRYFDAEIAPVTIDLRKRQINVTQDEYPRADCTYQALQNLAPAFDKNGSVTAGNASGINDGASAILLVSGSALKRHHLTPIAELIEYGQGAIAPEVMGLGPVSAIANTLTKADMAIEDIDLFELNEAFAAQALGVIRSLTHQHNIDEPWILKRSNVCGGAIALGHPVGASGNRIVTTLVHQLQRTRCDYGLASLCIGGGMGTAMIIKRCY